MNYKIWLVEVRWLSKGNSSVRFYELKDAIEALLESRADQRSNQAQELHECTENDEFWQIMAYLSDIFEVFNNCNISMQGRDITVFKVRFCSKGFF